MCARVAPSPSTFDPEDPPEISPLTPIAHQQLQLVACPPLSLHSVQTRHNHEMEAPSPEDPKAVVLAAKDPYADMAIHAQELDFDELNKLDSLLADDSTTTTLDAAESVHHTDNGNSDTESNLDDILPEESFSTHPSPSGSQVDGKAYRKPPISIFQTDYSPPEPTKPHNTDPTTPPTAEPIQSDPKGLPSPPETPASHPDRAKDDVPGRYSDIEGTPPMRAAGFVGDEIPRVDPLDSDGEWAELADFRKKFSMAGNGDEASNLSVMEDKKKKKKRKKKSKGVWSPLCNLFNESQRTFFGMRMLMDRLKEQKHWKSRDCR
jgi:hypothetical protein